MKKLIASALALTMALGMTSMAFAATDATGIKVNDSSKFYTEDDGILIEYTGRDLTLEPGDSIYVEVIPVDGDNITSKLASQHKIVLDWAQGGDQVSSSAIESKKIQTKTDAKVLKSGEATVYGMAKSYENEAALLAAIDAVKVHTDAACTTEGCTDADHFSALTADQKTAVAAKYTAGTGTAYKYVAGVTLKASFSVKTVDLIGTMKVVKKTASSNTAAETVAITGTVGYEKEEGFGDTLEVNNDAPVVSFKGISGDVELLFDNIASFTVGVSNQSALFLGYTTTAVEDIVDQNEEADIEFISFKANPGFNRIGDLRLYADKGYFIYELAGGSLKALDAKFDEDYEAYLIKTRALGTYVISDRALTYKGAPVTSESSGTGSSDTTTKPNPGTGASSMMNVAMAVAAISLAGVGALGMKKKG